ncbi:MAG: hypothetical protein KOO69_03130 [Victivallales bacterium]|nr:hypothetical protein [Victivallales bacterium]
MTEEQTYDFFKDCAVSAESVQNFLDRYYKHDRYKGRGEEYSAHLLASYEREFAERGFCTISLHDNVIGKHISFYGKDFGGRYADTY